ncbi:siroheme synthase [Sphingobium sp. SCG-1]|uniref:precorrin-2 dehydrogenase/sirohydrochlorin ferrochelatase family protein n=1 Tax=Sphingobium sp. SCG-1 TaxID=2072936 RepID=UPI000CD67F32|nr:bifunctional precorrin-2 dehydrogenase/sirohydrochlorin ferrochelatase [Sphingobium sp. SCG-1]AUW56948.1 siroheme synthase [Sphingobium sp. SCG-1]
MHSLPLFVRLAGRPVILLGDGEAADAKRRLLERADALIVGEDAQAALAIVATEDDAEAEAQIARLKARGVLVNAVDRPVLCDFTLPAIVDRDPVLIAVGTGGASAGLAKAVRQRIEALLPPNLGHLARALEIARSAMKARWPLPAQRRRALDAALAAGGALDPLAAHGEGAVERWLKAAEEPVANRIVAITLVSGNPDDMTLRTARLLGEADRIFHAGDVPAAILDRARADAQRIIADALPTEPGPGLSLWLEMNRD